MEKSGRGEGVKPTPSPSLSAATENIPSNDAIKLVVRIWRKPNLFRKDRVWPSTIFKYHSNQSSISVKRAKIGPKQTKAKIGKYQVKFTLFCYTS